MRSNEHLEDLEHEDSRVHARQEIGNPRVGTCSSFLHLRAVTTWLISRRSDRRTSDEIRSI